MILLLLASLSVSAAPGAKLPKLAVADVQDVSAKDPTLARSLTQIVAAEVTQTNRFRVITSSEISELIGLERQRQLMGCNDESSCLAELAGAMGVDYLLSGQLSRVGSRYRLDLRLLDAHQAAILVAAGDFLPGTEDGAADGAQRLVRQMLADPRFPGATGSSPDLTPSRAMTTQAEPDLQLAKSDQPGRGLGPKVVLGLAGALLVTAGIFAGLAASQYSQLKGESQNPQPTAYDATASQVRRDGNTADFLAIGALVAGAAGGAWWWYATPAASGSGGEVGAGARW